MSLLSNSEMMHQKPNPNMIKDPFNRKSYLSHGELGLSQLQHYVGPDNVPELRAVHRDAYPTAIFYLATILGLYLLGLLTILIHYMNSSYGKWAWTLSDVWDEIRPSFWCRTSSETTCTAVETKRPTHDENEICDDEEECSLPKKRVRKVSNLISNTASTQMSLARRILFHSRLGPQNQKVPQSEDNKNVCSSSLDPNTTSSSSQRQTTTMVSTCTTSSINHESKPIIQVVAVDINHGMQC